MTSVSSLLTSALVLFFIRAKALSASFASNELIMAPLLVFQRAWRRPDGGPLLYRAAAVAGSRRRVAFAARAERSAGPSPLFNKEFPKRNVFPA